MRKRSRNTALLGKRALSLLVAAVIALSMFAVVSIASASAQSTYYLDTSSNTAARRAVSSNSRTSKPTSTR